MRADVIDELDRRKFICIFRGASMSTDDLGRACGAVLKGGSRIVEITYDHNDRREGTTLEEIRYLKGRFGSDLIVGAGTVLTKSQVDDAHTAGAEFAVSPVLGRDVIAEAHKLDMMVMPGCCSATEAYAAYLCGAY